MFSPLHYQGCAFLRGRGFDHVALVSGIHECDV